MDGEVVTSCFNVNSSGSKKVRVCKVFREDLWWCFTIPWVADDINTQSPVWVLVWDNSYIINWFFVRYLNSEWGHKTEKTIHWRCHCESGQSKQLMVSGDSLINGIPANKDLGYIPKKRRPFKPSWFGRLCPFSNFQVLWNLVFMWETQKNSNTTKNTLNHVGKLSKLHTALYSSTWTSSWKGFASRSHK